MSRLASRLVPAHVDLPSLIYERVASVTHRALSIQIVLLRDTDCTDCEHYIPLTLDMKIPSHNVASAVTCPCYI